MPDFSTVKEPDLQSTLTSSRSTKPNRSQKKTRKKSPQDERLIRLALHQSPYFSCLDEEQMERFVRYAKIMRFHPGQVVILEGCRDDLDRGEEERDANHGLVESSGPADIDDLYEIVDSVRTTTLTKLRNRRQNQDENDDDQLLPPIPADSGSPSYLFIVRKGSADVFCHAVNPASFGPGALFGEGGFLFRRQHSASVVASDGPLECFVVDRDTFINKVLTSSQNMRRFYRKHAEKSSTDSGTTGGEEELHMTVDELLHSLQEESASGGRHSLNSGSLSVANAYHDILRTSVGHYKKNHISFQDFCLFHLLMAMPDPEVDIAFMLMDRNGTGTITKKDFQGYLASLPYYFDQESEFVERYFGHGQTIRAHQFSQFLADLQKEMGRQTFLHKVKEFDQHRGYLPAQEFINLLKKDCGWKLPEGVVERMESLYCQDSSSSYQSTVTSDTEDSKRAVLADLERHRNMLGTRYFAYVDFVAFQNILIQLPAICNLIERACESKKGPISLDDFKVANRILGIGGQLSRQQVDIVFQLFDLDNDGYVTARDAFEMCGMDIENNRLHAVEGRDGINTFSPPPNYPKVGAGDSTPVGALASHKTEKGTGRRLSLQERLMKYAKQFFFFSVAGGLAVVPVYPMDLVKTRMMNQRTVAASTSRMYSTSFDCLKAAFQYEGLQGLYRGMLPSLIAVGPEKFIKYTVNDLMRNSIRREAGQSYEWLTEYVSGGCAGACQLLVTNPLEITKIRLQMQGETSRVFKEKGFPVPKGLGLNHMSFSTLVSEMGISGLYKGASACLLRDILFGAIYFPTFTASKKYLASANDLQLSETSNSVISGSLAVIPACLFTSPMDFIKTRLQVAPRPGETIYNGIADCVYKVYEREGPSAFFKGLLPRVCRLSPQYGISLYIYEKLSQLSS